MNVKSLVEVQNAPDEEIVGALSEALEAAKAGRVKALVLITHGTDGVKACTRIGRRDEIVYALEYVKHRCLIEAG